MQGPACTLKHSKSKTILFKNGKRAITSDKNKKRYLIFENNAQVNF